MSKQVITADAIVKAAKSGNKIIDKRAGDCIITPGARDKIDELGVRFADDSAPASDSTANVTCAKKDVCSSSVNTLTDQVCAIIRDRIPGSSVHGLETLVQNIVKDKLSENPVQVASTATSSGIATHEGVSHIDGSALLDGLNGPNVAGKVAISDAMRSHLDASHATTFITWQNSSFDRTLQTAEIDIVIAGELALTVAGKTFHAKAGDVLYLADGATVTYSSPSTVKLACVNV